MLCCPMLRTFNRRVGRFEHIELFTVTNTDRPREGCCGTEISQRNAAVPRTEVFGDTTSNATPIKVSLSAGTDQLRVVVNAEIETDPGLDVPSATLAQKPIGDQREPRLGSEDQTRDRKATNRPGTQGHRLNPGSALHSASQL